MAHDQKQQDRTAGPQPPGGQVRPSHRQEDFRAEQKTGKEEGGKCSHRRRTWAWDRWVVHSAALHPERLREDDSEEASPSRTIWTYQPPAATEGLLQGSGALTRFRPRRRGATGPASSKPSTSSSGTRRCMATAPAVSLGAANPGCL